MADSATMRPEEIESESFAIITRELGERTFPDDIAPVVKRVIHTTADFEYADNLYFSQEAIEAAHRVFREGGTIITDTNMALAGISKPALEKLSMKAACLVADGEVARRAKEEGVTRSRIAVDEALERFGDRPLIYAVGNAPTALLRLLELTDSGKRPALVIGVPVGFVNVVEAKEQLIASDFPNITAQGRKGGSNVAAAICNALLYQYLGMR